MPTEYKVHGTKKGAYPIKVESRSKGKVVTVVSNVHGNADALRQALQAALGAGGVSRGDGSVEIQGNHEAKIIKWLQQKEGCLTGVRKVKDEQNGKANQRTSRQQQNDHAKSSSHCLPGSSSGVGKDSSLPRISSWPSPVAKPLPKNVRNSQTNVKVVLPIHPTRGNAYARFDRMMKSWPYWEHDYSRLRQMFEESSRSSFLESAGAACLDTDAILMVNSGAGNAPRTSDAMLMAVSPAAKEAKDEYSLTVFTCVEGQSRHERRRLELNKAEKAKLLKQKTAASTRTAYAESTRDALGELSQTSKTAFPSSRSRFSKPAAWMQRGFSYDTRGAGRNRQRKLRPGAPLKSERTGRGSAGRYNSSGRTNSKPTGNLVWSSDDEVAEAREYFHTGPEANENLHKWSPRRQMNVGVVHNSIGMAGNEDDMPQALDHYPSTAPSDGDSEVHPRPSHVLGQWVPYDGRLGAAVESDDSEDEDAAFKAAIAASLAQHENERQYATVLPHLQSVSGDEAEAIDWERMTEEEAIAMAIELSNEAVGPRGQIQMDELGDEEEELRQALKLSQQEDLRQQSKRSSYDDEELQRVLRLSEQEEQIRRKQQESVRADEEEQLRVALEMSQQSLQWGSAGNSSLSTSSSEPRPIDTKGKEPLQQTHGSTRNGESPHISDIVAWGNEELHKHMGTNSAEMDYTVLLEWVVQLTDSEAKDYLVEYLGEECKAFADELVAVRMALANTT